jgi:hypothetical protein
MLHALFSSRFIRKNYIFFPHPPGHALGPLNGGFAGIQYIIGYPYGVTENQTSKNKRKTV